MEEHDVTRPIDHPDQVMEDLSSTRDDPSPEAASHRSITTTRQIRKRKRIGRDGCIVEEEQEVLVKTTVIRWSQNIGTAETEPGLGKGKTDSSTKRMEGSPSGDGPELLPDGDSSLRN